MTQTTSHRPLIAALLSAFVFPGAGLWYLGHFTRALIFAVPALFAFGYLLQGIVRTIVPQVEIFAQEFVDRGIIQGRWDADWGELISRLMASVNAVEELRQAQWILLCAWALGIAVSFVVGVRESAPAPSLDPKDTDATP